jgi:hypothetical protein
MLSTSYLLLQARDLFNRKDISRCHHTLLASTQKQKSPLMPLNHTAVPISSLLRSRLIASGKVYHPHLTRFSRAMLAPASNVGALSFPPTSTPI